MFIVSHSNITEVYLKSNSFIPHMPSASTAKE